MGRETCVTQVASSFKTSISSGPRSCLLIQSSKHLMPQVSHLLWDSGPHLRAATSGSSLPFNIARRYLHATMLSMLSWLAIFSVISTRGSISGIGSNSVFLSRVSTLERGLPTVPHHPLSEEVGPSSFATI